MKKIIALILSLAAVLSLTACCHHCNNQPQQIQIVPAPQPAVTYVAPPVEYERPVAEPEAPSGSAYAAQITGYERILDYEGRECLVVKLKWTNKSQESVSYFTALNGRAYQGGIELGWGYPGSKDKDLLTLYENRDLNLRPGASVEVAEVFVLRDRTNTVEIEIYEWISLDPIIVASDLVSLN